MQSDNIQNSPGVVSSFERAMMHFLVKIRPAFLLSLIKKFLFPLIKRRIVKTPYGTFYLALYSHFGQRVLAGNYESWMDDCLKKFLKPGDCFIDLGAHEGLYSVIASKLVTERGKVIAVEPQARCQKIIKRNITLNYCKNVTVIQTAVRARKGKTLLYLAPESVSWSSSTLQATRYPWLRERVTAMPLSDIFRQENVSRCNLLKIDIEGDEREVILSSQELFKNHIIRAIAISMHPRLLAKRGFAIKDIEDFLTTCGYVEKNGIFYVIDT